MKRLGWILVLLMAASPAWAAKKVTVQQLKDLLVTMQQGKKADFEISTWLKGIELTEELTAAAKLKLLFFSPGPLTSE
jgi:purine nucleoside permease